MSGRDNLAAAARLASLSDDELAAALADLGRSLVAPEPADLPASVMRRLEAPSRAARGLRVTRTGWLGGLVPRNLPLRRALVLALVAAVVLAGVAAALGIGLPGIRIFFGPAPSAVPSAFPSAVPSAAAPPSGAIPGAGLSLGRPVSLTEARAVADYPVGVPALAGLGDPDAVWLDTSMPGPVVTLVWGPRAGATATQGVGLLLSEIPGSINTAFFEKFVGQGTQLQPAGVGDGGWWITGALHEVAVVGANGDVRFETVRLSGNVLLWSSGRVTFRLETSLDEPRALEIAGSVR